MSARRKILSLLNRYSYTVDTGDFEGFAALYENGEWYVEGNTPNRGCEEITENILSRIILYQDGTPRTRHVITNVELDIDKKLGTAKCQRYVTVLQGAWNFPLQVIFSGHYHDDFVREKKQWRFARTVVRNPIAGDMSQHLASDAFIQT